MVPVLLLAVAALSALIFGLRYAGDDRIHWHASAVKTTSTAALAVCGVVIGSPPLIIVGLALGAIGDFALSRAGDRWFLTGMVAFALGHLVYVGAFAAWIVTPLPALVLPVLALMVPVLIATLFWIAPRAGGLCLPVRLYAVIITAMALAAAALPDSPDHRWLQIGVAMFVASDFVLALRMFVLTQPGIRLIAARTLWPLYWGGQALILWAASGG